MIKTHSPFLIIAAFVGVLSSCQTFKTNTVKKAELPASYDEQMKDTFNISNKPWNAFYQDSSLKKLISTALEKNFDTKIALERTAIANAELAWNKSNLLPSINASARSNTEKFGEYTMNGIGNDDTNLSEHLPPDKHMNNPYTEFFAGLTFSWEVNLWGKLSNKRKAALSRMMASKEMQHGVTTWLISSIAEHYYELLGLDQEKKVLQENLRLQELGLELVRIQKTGGKVNQLAVDQFESQMLNTKTRLVRIDQEILTTESELNQLLGRYPQTIHRKNINEYVSLPEDYIGNPDDLIFHRPDVREAEYQLVAADADVMVARAAFYPSLKLNGSAGFSAFSLSKLFLTPGSAIYTLGAGLSAPLFQRGQIKALYASSTARQRITLTQYQKTLLNSYYEVYVVWHNAENLEQQITIKEEEAFVLRRAFSSSNDLFSVGFATYLEVITAQRRLLDVELELTELKKDQLKNMAVLYRSLGGGWINEG